MKREKPEPQQQVVNVFIFLEDARDALAGGELEVADARNSGVLVDTEAALVAVVAALAARLVDLGPRRRRGPRRAGLDAERVGALMKRNKRFK